MSVTVKSLSAQSISFAGFGNEALIAISALMMVGKALETTGAHYSRLPRSSAEPGPGTRCSLCSQRLIAGAILSAFMNNTPIVVLLMPILVGASIRSKFPVSEVMMPMGLATIIGGMSTTIGTSTNLLVVGIANDMGQHDVHNVRVGAACCDRRRRSNRLSLACCAPPVARSYAVDGRYDATYFQRAAAHQERRLSRMARRLSEVY